MGRSVIAGSSSRMVGLLTLVSLCLSTGLVLAKPQFGSFSPSYNVQNCGYSQCYQSNNAGGGGGYRPPFGGGGGGYRPPFGGGIGGYRPPYQPSQPSYNQQNCFFGQCQQNNYGRRRRTFRRGKREAEIASVETESETVTEKERESQVKSVECGADGLTGSSCVNSQCEISCADGQLHNVDCEGLTPVVSSPQQETDGKVVVTVSCGGGGKLPSCFPFCFVWAPK